MNIEAVQPCADSPDRQPDELTTQTQKMNAVSSSLLSVTRTLPYRPQDRSLQRQYRQTDPASVEESAGNAQQPEFRLRLGDHEKNPVSRTKPGLLLRRTSDTNYALAAAKRLATSSQLMTFQKAAT